MTTYSTWEELIEHIRDNYDFETPDDLWTWENFSEEILDLKNSKGFGDEIEFLGLKVTEDGRLLDVLKDDEKELSTGMVCVLTYYSLSDQVEDRITENEDDWVNFWQLPGGGAKEISFDRTVVSEIGQKFIPKPEALEAAAVELGGEVVGEGQVEVPTLPLIRMRVNISPKTGEFPPSCSVYFQRRSANYLPTDNLTDMGTLLKRQLETAASPEVIELEEA